MLDSFRYYMIKPLALLIEKLSKYHFTWMITCNDSNKNFVYQRTTDMFTTLTWILTLLVIFVFSHDTYSINKQFFIKIYNLSLNLTTSNWKDFNLICITIFLQVFFTWTILFQNWWKRFKSFNYSFLKTQFFNKFFKPMLFVAS